jgi:hypothetical protein
MRILKGLRAKISSKLIDILILVDVMTTWTKIPLVAKAGPSH